MWVFKGWWAVVNDAGNWDDESQLSLRANADEVTATLQAELQERLRVAGVDVLDTRLRNVVNSSSLYQ